jgi:NAD-dependent dihydropyrimidine dehydrogenase PreA subunit
MDIPDDPQERKRWMMKVLQDCGRNPLIFMDRGKLDGWSSQSQDMYFPKIDPRKCKNSEECFKICPEDVFDLDSNGVLVARPGDCTKCEACVAVCPEHAITVEEM